MAHTAVFATIAGATAAWAVAECWRLIGIRLREARVVWTAGALLMIVHAAAAFMVFYHGSHRAALVETARQTAALTGVTSGAGLYLNYAFVTMWAGDCLWWWLRPSSYAARSPHLALWLRVFFLFMFVNGAVIFADGWMRVVGLVAVTAVTATWYGRSRSPRRRASAIP